MTQFLTLLFTTLGGLLLTITFFRGQNFIDVEKKSKEAKELVFKSEEEAKRLTEETKERTDRYKKNMEEGVEQRMERIEKRKITTEEKEQNINKKENRLKDIKFKMVSEKEATQSIQERTKRVNKEIIEKLSVKTGQNKDGYKEKIINDYKRELSERYEERGKYNEENQKEEIVAEAKRIIISSLQKLSSPTSVETRAVHVRVLKDSVKGKIVGEGARNVVHLEKTLGVAVVFNDMPQAISVSAFNLVNRRIAQRALEKLVKEKGEISTKTIDKHIEHAKRETDEELYEIGKKAITVMGFDWQDKDLLRTIGRLKYRTSYGQNIMKHSMEVSWVCMMLASEAGLDIETARVAGFLHDIGKAIDQDPEVQDTHDLLTKEIMERYNFSKEEVHAAWVHHDAEPQETPEAFLVKAADAVSASRPGARAESIYSYGERIEALKEVVASFNGISKSFAISGGREIRVYVKPNEVKDSGLTEFVKKIADKIEEDVVYPGKIKVNLIRRVEHSEHAKAKI